MGFRPSGLVVFFGFVLSSAALADTPYQEVKAPFDVRVAERDDSSVVVREPSLLQTTAARELELRLGTIRLRWDGLSGAPAWLARADGGVLSAPLDAVPETSARDFLEENAALFGLSRRSMGQLRLSSSVTGATGWGHVYFVQELHELEVHQARVTVNLRPSGSVHSVAARLFGGEPEFQSPLIDAASAARVALADVYPELSLPAAPDSVSDAPHRLTTFSGPEFGRPLRVDLVLFPDAKRLRLAWRIRVAERHLITDYRILVDAQTGELLSRENMTLYAEAQVLDAAFPAPSTEETAPDGYGLQPIPASTPESPGGWIGDPTSLNGNNASSHLDYYFLPGLADPAGIYEEPFASQRSALVNIWWWANEIHDWLYARGFDEASGNFQEDNFGKGGVAGDSLGTVKWNSFRNNAFYTRSDDGEKSFLNMLWLSCSHCGEHDGYPENGGERSSGYSLATIVHEYVHGLTTRMAGGPADGSCLSVVQAGALGEGFSDVFSSSYLDEPRYGEFTFYGLGFTRDPRNELHYGDLCQIKGSCSVHANGMIWFGAMWELRQSMQALRGSTGIADFERLLVESLRFLPCNPSMLDARDALFDADAALYGGVHHTLIWNIVAARGMGEGANTTGPEDTEPNADFTVPAADACTPPAPPTGLVAAADGDNRIRLSFNAPGASGVEVWREDADTFVDDDVHAGKRYRYAVRALGSGGVACRSALSAAAEANTTGSCEAPPLLLPQLDVSDAGGSCALSINWNGASPGCSSEPVVYNVFRGRSLGFEPDKDLLIARTEDTHVIDYPPVPGEPAYYLVTAQHGTLEDDVDLRDRGASHVLDWQPGLATQGRSPHLAWGFDDGDPAGWTVENQGDTAGGWTLVEPSGSVYSAARLAPDAAAGGAGFAWVTGDAGGPSRPHEHDVNFSVTLTSPLWDATENRTLLSFDVWCHIRGLFGLQLQMSNGTETATTSVCDTQTVQGFMTDSTHSWQRVELDLARYLTPTETMSVTFQASPTGIFAEYGIDDVRVEQGVVCSRPSLVIESVTVDDGRSGWGNGNGLLEPGETAELFVELRNSGSGTALAPEGRVVSSPSNVLVHDESVTYPDIPEQATGTSGSGFTVTLSDEGECRAATSLAFHFVDAEGAVFDEVWTTEHGTIVTDVILQDDFETDQGWFVDGASLGQGRWERGEPVETRKASLVANPASDSPRDANALCYVTENGSPGGNADLTDVDDVAALLLSPPLDLSAHKRAELTFDLWYFDSSSFDFLADEGSYGAFVDDGFSSAQVIAQRSTTNGWEERTLNLHEFVPMVENVRLRFRAVDGGFSAGGTEDTLEMGVDNVLVEGERAECAAPGVENPPTGINDSLMLTKEGSIRLYWNPSVADPQHEPAAYYDVHASSTPDAGFSIVDSTTRTMTDRAPDLSTRFYRIVAVNAAGDSGDAPAP